MAPPPPRLPRLPEGRAGAGAGRGVAEPGARAGGEPSRLAAGPTRPPGLRHPPSPGFCEVALTWRSLRGGRSAPASVAARSPLVPRGTLRDLQKRTARSSPPRPGPAEADLSPGLSGVPRRRRELRQSGAALLAAGGLLDPAARESRGAAAPAARALHRLVCDPVADASGNSYVRKGKSSDRETE